MEFSETQKNIVYAKNGPMYLKANASTGKMRVLTERVRYLLSQTKRQILVLTFTYKAIEEIKVRLNDIPKRDERIFIGTFYDFCHSVLKNHRYHIGLGKMPYIFKSENDKIAFIDQAIAQTPSIINSYKTKGEQEQNNLSYQALKFIANVKQNFIKESDFDKHTDYPDFILLYQNYQGLLHDQNAIDDDDLLLLVYKLFINSPSIAELYRRNFFAICIDEAHHLSKAQYYLLKALTKSSESHRRIKNPYQQLSIQDISNSDNNNVMLIENINPSGLYLNGLSFNNLREEFIKDFNPKIIELNENYRLSISILNAIKKITPNIERGYSNNIVKKGIFELQGLKDEEKEAKWIIDKINELISMQEHQDIEGQITYEKIAVLARNNYVFNALEKVLTTSKMPFFNKIIPGLIKFESHLMQRLDLVLFENNSLKKETLLKFSKKENINISSEDISPIIQILKKIRDYIIKPMSGSKGETRNILSEDFKKEVAEIEEDENERNMIFNDINELQKHWKGYKLYPDQDHRPFHQLKNAMILKASPPSQCKGITLSTVDAMKGQEFDIVFLMGMDDETFPDYRAIQNGGIDLKQEENNLYVAFTRAKRFLYVTWPQKRKMPWGDEKNRKISRLLETFDL